ncbi:MAG: hypothetical protein JNL92_22635 [Opitutaceae bacterium]|nr:hypothetical protein [Opitutaceae bacterium]
MKKASNVRLSLRKLCIAMMAVGPIAVLPAPLMAAPPVSAPYYVSNGTAVWATSGSSATLQLSDKAVLVWNAGSFNVAAGDTYNFTLPSGGAVLNKVGYQTTGALGAVDNAVINGTLFSTGRVFVLANGNISIGDGANITTVGGLVLSTRVESSDFSFTTSGNLTFTGNGTGNVTIGAPTVAIVGPQISGNLEAIGNTILSNRGNVTGDLILRSILANSTLELSATGNLGVSGNLTVVTNNGLISASNAIITGNAVGNQTASFSTGSTGNNSITLANAANDFEWVTVSAPGTFGNVTIAESNIITLGASTVGGNLQVNATGTGGSNAISTNGALAVTGTSNFSTATNNSAISIGSNSTFTGMVNASATANSVITINATGNMTVGDINAGTGNRSGIALTAGGGVLTIAGALVAIGNSTASTNITMTGGSIVQNGTISLTSASGSNVSFNATAGGITINNTITAPRVVANSSTANGAITQGAVITTTNATATSTFNAGTGNITLNQANVFAAGQTLQFTGGTVGLTNTNNTVIGTSNVTGNLTLAGSANNTIQLGTGSGTDSQNITVGGVLTASTSGTGEITDGNYTAFNIFGGMNLTTAGGNVTLDAATANGGLAPNVQYGQVNINAGSGIVSVAESTGLNLGNITGSSLAARSVGGVIVDSGNISVGTGTANFTVSSAGSVVLDGTNHTIGAVNVIGGTDHNITIGSATRLGNGTAVAGNLTIVSGSGNTITLGDNAGGSVSVGNLTVNSGGAIVIDGGILVTGTANLTAADSGALSITDNNTVGRMQVAGATTLSSAGTILLDGGQDFSSVVLNGVSGNTTILDLNNVSISGNATGAVNITAGANSVVGVIAAPWALTLGNLNAGSLNARAQDGGGGISGTLTQLAGTALHIENTAAFTTEDANLIVGNDGNSFGRVEATIGGTTASRTLTLVEDGTLKVGTISSRGSSTVTSRFGSIIEDTLNNVTVTNNGTLTLNAVNGSILLGNTTHTVGSTSGNLTAAVINAPNGAAAVISNNQIALGNVNANSLTVTTTGTGTGNITQTQGLKVFGSASFVSVGNIVLSNTTNNFGRVALTTSGAAKNITITESGTLNLGNVSMPLNSTGNFVATSVNGDIIDTGLGGVRPGGTIVPAVVPTLGTGNGTVTLSALNGNIVLDDPTTDFPTSGGVVFNAQNVTLSPLGQSILVLGAANLTSVAGNLTVTSAIGSITNAGDLNIAGTASFQSGSGNISIGQSGNRFGAVRFIGNQVSISQVNDMNILKGSAATGPAQLASTGSYVTIAPDGSGVVSFGNTVGISASSSITLPDAVQAVGLMTVNAAGTKDLSALSIAGDLGGQTPVNLGTGTYVAPQP